MKPSQIREALAMTLPDAPDHGRRKGGRAGRKGIDVPQPLSNRSQLERWSWTMLFWPYYVDGLARWWRPAARQESEDQRLARVVSERLRSDPWTCLEPVHVQVQNRVVILEGHVDSERARWAAVYQAWQTPGVFDVCDALTDRRERPA